MTKRTEILIATHCFPAGPSDIPGNFLADLCRSLKDRNASVTVMTQKMSGEHDPEFLKSTGADIRYFDWAGGNGRFSGISLGSPRGMFEALSLVLSGRKAFRRTLKERNFDIIISAWAVPSGLWTYRTAESSGALSIVWALGSDITVYSGKLIPRRIINAVLKRSDRVFSNSIYLNRIILSVFGKKAGLLYTNRTLPEPGNKYAGSDKLKLVYIGRMEHIKGPDILLEALKEADIPEFELKMIGTGSMEDSLKKMSAEFGFSNSIEFTGPGDARLISDTLAVSDYLVISSRHESMPVVFWEAMQTGTPVISTDCGDIKYYCEKYNVGRIAGNGPSTLGEMLRYAYDFRPMRTALSANTSKLKDISLIEKSAEKILSLIRPS